MRTKTYNFLERNTVQIIDTCATILLVIAGLLFADNLGTLFLITMALLPFQELVRKDNISGKRLCWMTIFGLVLTMLTVLSGPVVTCSDILPPPMLKH